MLSVFWIPFEEIHSQGIDSLVVRLSESGDANNNWDYQFQNIDSFNSGIKQSTLSRNWNVNQWKNNLWWSFIYDVPGNLLNKTTHIWDSLGWKNSNRTLNTYNAGNFILNELNQQWSGSAWINDNQKNYSYDSNNRDTLVVSQKWINSTWKNSSQTQRTFNVNGFLLVETLSIYDTLLSSWKLNQRFLHTPHSLGLDNEIVTQYFNSSDSTWGDYYKEVYGFDSLGNKISLYTYYYIGLPGDPWDHKDQIQYDYDSLGRYIGFTNNCAGACGFSFGNQSYDSFNRVLLIYNYSESMGGIISQNRQHFYYLDYPNSSSLYVFLQQDFERCSADPIMVGAFSLGGNGPLSYQWSPSAGLSSTSIINPLSMADSTVNYLFQVTDTSGATASANITISAIQSPAASIIIQSIDTASSCNSAMLSTDSTSLLYCRWYRDDTLQVNPYGAYAAHFPIVQNGNYKVKVENFEGCQSVDSIKFLFFNSPASVVSFTSSCNQLIAHSPQAVSFQWYNGGNPIPGATNDTLVATLGGDYKVKVTNQSGCVNFSNQQIFRPMFANMNLGNTCPGACDGFASAVVYNSTPPNQYLWSSGETTSSLDSLCHGNYSVTVTDSRGCVVTKSDSVINFNDFPVYNIISSTVTGAGACDGAAYVNFPAPNYYSFFTYLWNDSSTSYANSVCAGWNFVKVKSNFHQCVRVDSIFVNINPSNVNCDAPVSKVNPSCQGICNGSVQVNGTGTIPFSYLWLQPDAMQSSSIANLCTGSYSVLMIDGNGCVDTGEVVLVAQDTIEVSFSVLSASPSQPCSTLVNANVTGGTPPYSPDWCFGLTQQNPAYLCPGNCSFYVQDIIGCTAQIVYDVPDSIVTCSYSATVQPASAVGVCDGRISLAINGTPPFTFSWLSGGTDSVLQNVCAGTYQFVSTDSNNCSISDSVIVGVDSSVGISQADKLNSLMIYPNPGHNELHIVLPEYISSEKYILKVYNSQGQVVYESNSVDKLPVNMWGQGIYEFCVQWERGVLKARWIRE